MGSDIDVFGLPYACEKCNDTGIADGKICECAEKLRVAESVKENPLILPCASGLSKIDFSYYGKGEPTKRKEAKYLEKGLLEGYKIFLLAGKTGTDDEKCAKSGRIQFRYQKSGNADTIKE